MMRICFVSDVLRRIDVHLPILSLLWDRMDAVIELHANIAVPPGLYEFLAVLNFDVDSISLL